MYAVTYSTNTIIITEDLSRFPEIKLWLPSIAAGAKAAILEEKKS